MNEDDLPALVRSAFPLVTAAHPARDLWPLVEQRSHKRTTWSWIDVGLAIVTAIALVTRPELLLFLAYHF